MHAIAIKGSTSNNGRHRTQSRMPMKPRRLLLRAVLASMHTLLACVFIFTAVAGDQPDIALSVGSLLCFPRGSNVTGASGTSLPSWLHAHQHTHDVCGVPLGSDAGQHFLSVPSAAVREDVFAVSVAPASAARCPTVAANALIHAHTPYAAGDAVARVQVIAAIAGAVGVANTSVTLTALSAASGV